jgi:predicted N-acetyltransferase YhbS
LTPVVVREALPSEYDEAGRVTSEAYRDFVPPDGDPAWEHYLATIADVAGRADRTTILVAVDEGRVVGSATLELAGKTEADEPPLRPEEAHIRMLGVGIPSRGRGVGRALVTGCEDRARAAGKTVLTLGTSGG